MKSPVSSEQRTCAHPGYERHVRTSGRFYSPPRAPAVTSGVLYWRLCAESHLGARLWAGLWGHGGERARHGPCRHRRQAGLQAPSSCRSGAGSALAALVPASTCPQSHKGARPWRSACSLPTGPQECTDPGGAVIGQPRSGCLGYGGRTLATSPPRPGVRARE